MPCRARCTPPERSRTSRRCGFTLIELLVVFSLLALLLTIAVPRYLDATDSAKERVRGQNLATIRDALDKFKADQGRYPAALAELVQRQYLRQVPLDPVTQSDQWAIIPVPGESEPGIYDVAAPASQSAETAQEAASVR